MPSIARATGFVTLIAIFVSFTRAASADDANPTRSPKQVAEKGLEFLIVDVAKWRMERQCATCHHGTMTLWVLNEAKSRGYTIEEMTLADIEEWTKDKFMGRLDKPRDTRPGWSMVNTAAIYFALMAQAVPAQKSFSTDELKVVVGHLLRHQEENGSWAWSSAPPKNRPPPFFESDEVATRMTYLALRVDAPFNDEERQEINESRKRAADWLATISPEKTTQSSLLELIMSATEQKDPVVIQAQINALIARQNEDGGWGQLDDRDSDAYATGQVLYALSLVGIGRDRNEVQRGIDFLVRTQSDDGSWPMTRRSHPGVTPGDFIVPITYFGSAWGTLGLLRTLEPQP